MKRNAADDAFSAAIRAAADYTCLRCGIQKMPVSRRGGSGLECSHVYSRRHRTIRWCVDNAEALCSGCHRWWHSSPADSGIWYALKVGDRHIELLREKRDSGVKVPKSEETEIAAHYREQILLIEQARLEGIQGPIEIESWQ